MESKYTEEDAMDLLESSCFGPALPVVLGLQFMPKESLPTSTPHVVNPGFGSGYGASAGMGTGLPCTPEQCIMAESPPAGPLGGAGRTSDEQLPGGCATATYVGHGMTSSTSNESLATAGMSSVPHTMRPDSVQLPGLLVPPYNSMPGPACTTTSINPGWQLPGSALQAPVHQHSMNCHPGHMDSARHSHSSDKDLVDGESAPGKAGQAGAISHSLVEKQRRDRINSLIDELRDLVPGQKAGPSLGKGEGSDARRPKHVVLADTITLLKHLTTKFQHHPLGQHTQQQQQAADPHSAPSPPAPAVKDEPSPSDRRKGSAASGKDDVEVVGALLLPHIPCRPTPNAGVTVEQGAGDTYFVQVKCRDRRGLLGDIINALRLMPLEVRTASVTTQADGRVVDMFEVKADDPRLRPEDLQNMVHDALFQAHWPAAVPSSPASVGMMTSASMSPMQMQMPVMGMADALGMGMAPSEMGECGHAAHAAAATAPQYVAGPASKRSKKRT